MIRKYTQSNFAKRLAINLASRAFDHSLRLGKYLIPIIKYIFGTPPLSCKKVIFLDKLVYNKIITITPASNREFKYPKEFQKKTKRSYLAEQPELSIYKLRNIIAWPSSRVFLDSNDSAIIERTTPLCSCADYSMNALFCHGKKGAIFKTFNIENTIESGIIITGFSDDNYYHTMIEIIPQIELTKHLHEEHKEYPILLPNKIIKNHSIFKIIRNSTPRQILPIEDKGISVINAIIINQPNNLVPNLRHLSRFKPHYNICRKESLDYIKKTTLDAVFSNQQKKGEKIFLARKQNRRKYNQESIIKISEEYGFEPYYMEDHSLTEQINIFQNAKYIIGPTGAAWTNLLFCTSGTKALCWMAEEYGDITCFSDLAFYAGVELEYLTIKTGKSIRDLYKSDYLVNEQKVEEWLTTYFQHKNHVQ